MRSLVDSLGNLILKDKAWVIAARKHIQNTLQGARAGGRIPEGSAAVGQEQMRNLRALDVGKSAGLELAPKFHQLAELLLCEHGEEVGMITG